MRIPTRLGEAFASGSIFAGACGVAIGVAACVATPQALPPSPRTAAPSAIASPARVATPRPPEIATAPAAPVSPPEAAPAEISAVVAEREKTLAELLAGEPEEAGVALGPRLHLGVGESHGPGGSFFFRLPSGWIDERTTNGTVWNGLAHPRRRDDSAKAVITSLGWKIGEAQIDVWTRFLHVTEARWGPEEHGPIAKQALEATFARGTGTLNGKRAELIYVVVTRSAGSILMIGAVSKQEKEPSARAGGPAERELFACLRGVSLR